LLLNANYSSAIIKFSIFIDDDKINFSSQEETTITQKNIEILVVDSPLFGWVEVCVL
jgi:hypothetical protein